MIIIKKLIIIFALAYLSIFLSICMESNFNLNDEASYSSDLDSDMLYTSEDDLELNEASFVLQKLKNAVDPLNENANSNNFQLKDGVTKRMEHISKKIYVCKYQDCNKLFLSRSGLIRHKRKHTGEKLVCNYPNCNQLFTELYAFTKHKREHTGERPYACDHEGCGKFFEQSCDLKKHKRTHNGERPYACNHEGCGKFFRQTSTLSRHKKVHIGVRPHVCNSEGCGKSFAQSWDLKKHQQKKHVDESPYKCAIPFLLNHS